MSSRVLPLVCALLILQGCGESGGTATSAGEGQSGKTAVHSFLNSIALGDGQMLKLDGRVVRYDLVRNQRGMFDRYIVESPLQQIGLEGAVFSELAQKGYVRKVRQDEASRYVVSYVLKGGDTLTADYRPWAENGANSRVVITRRSLEQ